VEWSGKINKCFGERYTLPRFEDRRVSQAKSQHEADFSLPDSIPMPGILIAFLSSANITGTASLVFNLSDSVEFLIQLRL
jgi:hypothetical protein